METHQVEVLPLSGPDRRSCVSLKRSWGVVLGGGGGGRLRFCPPHSCKVNGRRSSSRGTVLSWKTARRVSPNSNFVVPNAETDVEPGPETKVTFPLQSALFRLLNDVISKQDHLHMLDFLLREQLEVKQSKLGQICI